MTEPNQAESHQAKNMEIVLRAIISIHNNGQMFSDPFLLKTLGIAPKSLHIIRKKLLGMKIIEQDGKKYPNNEKLYRIINLKEAEKLLEIVSDITFQKFCDNEYGKYFANYKIHIPSEISIEYDKKLLNKNLPEIITRKQLLRNYCPICKRKTLRNYRKGQMSSSIDRQCRKCQINLLYRSYPALIQVEKY